MAIRAYIFDIDGTLADASHRMPLIEGGMKNWRAFFRAVSDDKPIHHMIRLARALDLVSQIVLVSGRSDECRDATEFWLAKHGVDGPLYMRKAGDYRPDDIVKIELLAELRADGFEPIMAFDDRSRVVQAWRAVGIPCAQVAEGNF